MDREESRSRFPRIKKVHVWNVWVSSVARSLDVDERLNVTWILRLEVRVSIWHVFALNLKCLILTHDQTSSPVQRSMSVCENCKAKHPNPVPFCCSCFIPSHLYRQTEEGNLYHVRSRMRRVFSDNGVAWPSCLGRDRAACCSQRWVDGVK